MRAAGAVCLLLLATLLATVFSPVGGITLASAQEGREPYRLRHEGGWLLVETDVVGLALNEHMPFFAWWYAKENNTVYVAHYKGLIEYHAWPNISLLCPHAWTSEIAKRLAEEIRYKPPEVDVGPLLSDLLAKVMALHVPVSEAELAEVEDALSSLATAIDQLREQALAQGDEELADELQELSASLADISSLIADLRDNPMDHKALGDLRQAVSELARDWYHFSEHMVMRERHRFEERFHKLKEVMEEAREEKLFHPPFFSFAEGEWEIDGPHDIKAPNGTVIGIWFTYKLVEVHNSAFKFAEDNIMIRCRLYFVPVQESVDGQLNYTVTRAELKQDFVVLSWRWNVDALKELAEELGISLGNLTSTEETGVALRLELLAMNASGLHIAGFLSGLEEPSELRDLLAGLAHEAKAIKEITLDACEELDDLAEEAIEALQEGATLDEIADLLQEMALVIENQLAALELHDSVLSKLEDEIAGLGQEEAINLTASIHDLLDEARDFLTTLNQTLAQAIQATDAAEAIAALASLRDQVSSFVSAFKTSAEDAVESIKDLAEELRETAARRCVMAHVRLGREEVDVRPDECMGREAPVRTRVGLREAFKVSFMTENATLAGWFKFVNASLVRYPNGTVEVMPVELAYLRTGRALHLFLIYGYFNGGSLEHDPSTGLDVPETAEAEPKYSVSAPTGGETSPVIQTTAPGGGPGPSPGPIAYLMTPQGLAIVAVGVVVVAVIIALARRRGRVVNIY